MQSVKKSEELFHRAKAVIPGGVNSPVRAFTQVGGTPRFIKRGEGAYIYDQDDNRYVDFIGSWGPMILGHCSNLQIKAFEKLKNIGTSFGAPTELEVEFAELMCGLIPGLDMIRLVSSGTEATMTAARLARGFTGKSKIIKFNGCYHGHSDSFLVQAGSGAATQGISGSLGVSQNIAADTISIEYNDISAVKSVVNASNDIAAIIVEPVPGNMGLIEPMPGFLNELKDISTKNNIILIFDEVMSGFRVSLKGASGLYGIVPDLFCYGKVIGGGMPMAAFGGRRDIMSILAPLGGVYQAGTLSGNPVAVTLGIETLKFLIQEDPYKELGERTNYFMSKMKEHAGFHGIPLSTNAIGSMFGFFFSNTKVNNYTEAKASNIDLFKKFFHEMLNEGVYFAPSAFEAGFIGLKHDYELFDDVLVKIAKVFSKIKNT